MEKENVRDFEINLREICLVLLKRIWIPIIAAILFYTAGFWYSTNRITPMYTSKAELLVISNNSAYSSSSIMMDDNFTKNYLYIIKNNHTILGNVIEKNGLDMSVSRLSSKISVSSPEETQIIIIYVTDSDPVMAQKISNSLCNEAKRYITDELIKADNIRITNEGTLPLRPSSPNVSKNATSMAFFGFVLACGVILLVHIINDAITTVEDAEKRLGLKVIGKVPYSHQLGNKRTLVPRKKSRK